LSRLNDARDSGAITAWKIDPLRLTRKSSC
jgi:hypothetical protein